MLKAEVATVEERAKAMGLSIAKLCERADISRPTWQRWKAGKNEPRWTKWSEIRRIVGLD